MGLRITEEKFTVQWFLWKLWPFFENWTLQFFLKLSIWHQHDQFMHYSTGPIYWLLTLKEFFRLGHFLGEKLLFFKKNFVTREVKEGIELEHCNLWGWCQNNGPTGGLLTLKEFFRLDHFWGKNSVFEKNFVVGRFQRRDWARAFKLGGMIRYIWGSGLLKKNSRFGDCCENYGRFSKNLT